MSNNKQWKEVDFEECPDCGSGSECLTDCVDEGYFYDGDQVRCLEKCGAVGNVSVDSDNGTAWISWSELL